MRTLILIVLALALVGCRSASREIADAAEQVQTNSYGVVSNLTEYLRIVGEIPKESVPIQITESTPLIQESILLTQENIDLAASVQTNVTGVEDSKNPWIPVFIWVSVAIALIVVLIVGLKTGIFGVIGSFVGLGASLIPRSVKTRAKFDLETLEETNDPKIKEKIAIERTNPVYNTAFVAEKVKSETHNNVSSS